ncbi:MAG: ferredoxin [Planctomycetota bacterium]
MADKNDKVAGSVTGKFYVDSQCIDCDLCRQTAPGSFQRNEEAGYSFVFKQPTTTEEAELCEQAAGECPVEAIGTDGDAIEAAAEAKADAQPAAKS